MVKRMILRSTVTPSEETPGMFKVCSKHYDGTPFSLKVNQFQFTTNEPFTEEKRTVDGWLFVEHMGQQGDRAFIVLPAATIEFGKTLSVSIYDLLPPNPSIKDYTK